MSTVGDILSTVGGVQYRGDIMSTVGYLEYRGGSQYREGYHDARGGIMSTVGVFSTVEGKIFCYLSTPRY